MEREREREREIGRLLLKLIRQSPTIESETNGAKHKDLKIYVINEEIIILVIPNLALNRDR